MARHQPITIFSRSQLSQVLASSSSCPPRVAPLMFAAGSSLSHQRAFRNSASSKIQLGSTANGYSLPAARGKAVAHRLVTKAAGTDVENLPLLASDHGNSSQSNGNGNGSHSSGALSRSDFNKFVQFFRQASPYIEGHRGRTFVIILSGTVRALLSAARN